MKPIEIDCVLYHNYEEGRLYTVCSTGKSEIVVSASDYEVVNNPDSIMRNLVMTALQETGQLTSFLIAVANLEVVDPATMRFLLDSKVEAEVYVYRKCDHCRDAIAKFIEKVVK